jgi:signal transduction histidine kinase
MRNVTSLHHLLEDVTGLARLQAGREQRHVAPVDVTPLMHQLCEGIQPLAQQRGLFLRCEGPAGFAADGDAIKIRRIAQNLILNAVKYTLQGGVTVKWGDSDRNDTKRWELSVIDTGPGFHTSSGRPMANALERADGSSPRSGLVKQDGPGPATTGAVAQSEIARPNTSREEAGEGIGLSIVKRLCEMLDATIELESEPNVGTSVRILFPRHYNS